QPPALLVTSSGGTLSVIGGQSPYQWINCANNEPIPGATGSTFTPTQSGSYAVISTSSTGCTSVSNCVNVIISSTDDLSDIENWSLSPNPTSGSAIIRWSEATRSESRLEVTDASGRLIYSQKIPAGSEQAEFDLAEYPSGIFNVRIISGTGVFAKKLVKTRI
ncbi:MAG: T9SS type A sorting domain-containing protein, partial [Bacteroidota bacterium]